MALEKRISPRVDPYPNLKKILAENIGSLIKYNNSKIKLYDAEEGSGYGKSSYYFLQQDTMVIQKAMSVWDGRSYSDELARELFRENLETLQAMFNEWNDPDLSKYPTQILIAEIEKRKKRR